MNISFNEIDEFIKIYINHNQVNSIVQVQNPNFNFKEEFKLNSIKWNFFLILNQIYWIKFNILIFLSDSSCYVTKLEKKTHKNDNTHKFDLLIINK